MIHKIASSLPSFKTLRLGPGLNIVLADRTERSDRTDTRNGSGKSSIVEILHFVLGSKAEPESMFRLPPLDEHSFEMTFDLGGVRVKARRSGQTHNRVTITMLDEIVQPVTLFGDPAPRENTITVAEWKRRLAGTVFGIHEEGNYAPSVRSCFSYFARRQAAGGFQTPTKHFSQQPTWDVQVNLSLLLGLDVELPRAWQRLRDRETQMDALRRAARNGHGARSVGELASELAVAQDEYNRLSDSVRTFTVVPTYSKVETEVTDLGQEVRRLNNQIISDRDYLRQLEQSLDDVHVDTADGLADLYAAADIQLPAVTLAAFDQVQTFHDSVIRNRRQYLTAEIQRITGDLASNTAARDQLADRRSDGLRLLSSGGAVETLVELQRDLVRRQIVLERLSAQYRSAVSIDTQQSDLRVERQRLAAALARDLAERQQALAPAYVIFERLSQQLYSDGQQGHLVISASDNGPQISATIPRGRSKGITNMQVYCFDMDLATLWSRQGAGPGFLVHDSHMFDGVDERQRDSALQAGTRAANNEGFQYIVMLNSDGMPKELPNGEHTEQFVVPVRLTDVGENGGLFGIRF